MYRSGTGSPLQAFICGLQGVNWASRVNVPRVIAIVSTVITAIGRRFQLFSPSPERNGRRIKPIITKGGPMRRNGVSREEEVKVKHRARGKSNRVWARSG